MVKKSLLFLLLSFLLFSCASGAPTSPASTVVTVRATAAAQPWLTELFSCANERSVILNVTSISPEVDLRVGEPEVLTDPAFQIDEEELLIVTNRQSPVQNLTLEEAQALFAGKGDPSTQVWAYASDTDVQMLFGQLVMNGRSVSSLTRLAAGPQEMSDLLNSESNAVGILPRHWKAGDVREVYSAGKVPVLAIVRGEATETIRSLMTCLSK
ncbi:MAG: hypothetical protein JNM55_06400 [Anaerolineales bacterium]|nr:hypothetical protein [Anaerolineales bacterium]